MIKKELRKAFQEGLITEDVFKSELMKMELQPKEKRIRTMLPKSLTPEEFKKLISVMPRNKRGDIRDRRTLVAFLLAYGAGLRISEVVGGTEGDNEIKPLERDNFQMDTEPQQIKVYGKYSTERIVPVPKGWKESFFEELPILRTKRALQKKFKRYNRLADLNPKYTFHSLRHGFATRLIESGVPITHVQYLLGHKNVSTTSRYVGARPLDALKSYEELF